MDVASAPPTRALVVCCGKRAGNAPNIKYKMPDNWPAINLLHERVEFMMMKDLEYKKKNQ